MILGMLFTHSHASSVEFVTGQYSGDAGKVTVGLVEQCISGILRAL